MKTDSLRLILVTGVLLLFCGSDRVHAAPRTAPSKKNQRPTRSSREPVVAPVQAQEMTVEGKVKEIRTDVVVVEKYDYLMEVPIRYVPKDQAVVGAELQIQLRPEEFKKVSIERKIEFKSEE